MPKHAKRSPGGLYKLPEKKDIKDYSIQSTDEGVQVREFVSGWNAHHDACVLVEVDVQKLDDLIQSKRMEWYPYQNRILPQKQSALLAQAIATAIENGEVFK